ncbi:hypothetical protein D9V37_18270 [Nocardioides mangrovicus]|uniref:Sulfotransferase family protein n=1 Tax=Nocardioides mangrovicus TaxID=2478913 RepID=A0A3L8NZF3_9ACTN|nr:hypothetical protein [Nocardioides mangrovicus]RLV48042.1 hypothetical protein D9V37_18270 [Nocardioides mangrovicus]
MARRVFLHVGAPKTGTTYLQSTFARNRTLLADHGLTYPDTAAGTHFEAAIDLIDHPWGGRLRHARGEWQKLAAAAVRAPGDALISHEVLAAATAENVRRAQESLAGAELHVVLTARDLGRQIPAEWQEKVKHRGRMGFKKFLHSVVQGPRSAATQWFWRVQSVPDVLGRWSAGLTPSQVHLVTVPPTRDDPELLLRRFLSVMGLDPSLALEPGDHDNPSLGIAEVSLLRRLNVALRGRAIPQPVYAEIVRDLLARDTLGHRDEQLRATLPPESRDFVEQVTGEWVEWVEGSGIDVVGDLGELATRWPPTPEEGGEPWVDPDRPRPARIIDAGVDGLAALVELEAARYREQANAGLWRRLNR